MHCLLVVAPRVCQQIGPLSANLDRFEKSQKSLEETLRVPFQERARDPALENGQGQ